MTSLATTVSTPVPVQRRRTRATLLTAAAVAAACALVDLLAPPSSGSHLSTAADYAFTALLIPLRARHARRDHHAAPDAGRPGRPAG